MRKTRLVDDAPKTVADRRAWLDCTKAELIFAVEKMGERVAKLEADNECYLSMIDERDKAMRERRLRIDELVQRQYEMAETMIRNMADHVDVTQDKEAKAVIAKVARCHIEDMLAAFVIDYPDEKPIEDAVSNSTRVFFRAICRAARYLPTPGDRGAILYALYDSKDYQLGQRWDYYDWYEIKPEQPDLYQGKLYAVRFEEEMVVRRVSDNGYKSVPIDELEEDQGV